MSFYAEIKSTIKSCKIWLLIHFDDFHQQYFGNHLTLTITILCFELGDQAGHCSIACVLNAKAKISAFDFKRVLTAAVQSSGIQWLKDAHCSKNWTWSTSQHTTNSQVTTSTYLHVLQWWSLVETAERFSRHTVQSTWEQGRSFISHFRKSSYSIQIIHCTASSATDFFFGDAIYVRVGLPNMIIMVIMCMLHKNSRN